MNFDYKSYSGNNDFRGFLAKNFKYALNYVGNDGLIDWNKVNSQGADTPWASYAPGTASKVQQDITKLYTAWQQANSQALYKPTNYGLGGYQAPAKAAQYDVTGNFNAAYGQAAASQNPFYDKKINELITEQRLRTEAKQHAYDDTLYSLNTAQKNLEEGNLIAEQRTGEDVSRAKEKIAVTEDEFQTDSGKQNTVDRIALARAQANAGTIGSGTANQQTATAEETRGTQEARQVRGFNEQKQAQDIVQSRTFEDLARSTKIGKEKTEHGTQTAKFDLDNYVDQLRNEVEGRKTDVEKLRAEAIKDEQANIARQRFNAYLNTLSDPVRVATIQKYQGSF